VTQLQLYNTLTRRKEIFQPIDPDNVRLYVCGPTVYDFAHIGNARPVIVFDVLFRLLRQLYGEQNVTYVRNITDVDDKINVRATRDYPDLPLNEAIRKVTEKTASQFWTDMRALGCLEPTHEPRATEFIAQMVLMIQTLIDKNHAYIAEGTQGREVLFRVSSMADYGALSNRNLSEQQAGARVAVEDHKENPADFVLWKESSAKEPGWDGEFSGETIHGRPGWHIECSAMSAAYLGKTFDIHGGGLDLIFPHHENEIAQSRCCHGTKSMANIWMHNGFLQVEGRKMSKSLGNFHTVNEVLDTTKVGGRQWHGLVVRFAMLMTHYREPIDFSVRRLEEAAQRLTEINTQCRDAQPESVPDELYEALGNDLNFSQALVVLGKLQAERSGEESVRSAGRLRASLEFLGLYHGGDPAELLGHHTADSPAEAEILARIAERIALLADKNWVEADRIRDDLLAEGIQLRDSKDSETGERVTTWEVKR
jgi:cysteinyl-tRNA synthetase